MKMNKRLLSGLLALVMMLGMIPLNAIATDETDPVTPTHIEGCTDGCTVEGCACTCHVPAHIDTCLEGCAVEGCACLCHQPATMAEVPCEECDGTYAEDGVTVLHESDCPSLCTCEPVDGIHVGECIFAPEVEEPVCSGKADCPVTDCPNDHCTGDPATCPIEKCACKAPLCDKCEATKGEDGVSIVHKDDCLSKCKCEKLPDDPHSNMECPFYVEPVKKCEYCEVELTEGAVHADDCLTFCTCNPKPIEGEKHSNKECKFYVAPVFDQLNDANTLLIFRTILLAQENREEVSALTVEEITDLTAKVEALFAAIGEPTEDDEYYHGELLETLTYLPAMECPECGEFGGHTEECIRNIALPVASGAFSSAAEYRTYKYVSDKDGGVREDEVALTAAVGNTYGGIPVSRSAISYEYAEVILGMNEASNLEIKVPSNLIIPREQKYGYPNDTYGTCGEDSKYPGINTTVNASAANKNIICDSDQYYVIYKDIGTYADKQNINLKVSVADYELIPVLDGHAPQITLRISDGKPGVDVLHVAWVKLKYEFLDDSYQPITVKGNTTYYDVDGSQIVHLNGDDNSCKGIYVTNDTLLYLGTFNGNSTAYSSNGVGVFERQNAAYSHSEGIDAKCAFTEIFEASTMYRTFGFMQNRGVNPNSSLDYVKETDITIDGSKRYHSDEWAGGLIFHSGLPVVRKTGDLTITKNVPDGCGDQDKEFTFTITLSEKLIGQKGDVTFNNGVATFKLKHGERVTISDLYEFLGYEIVESDNENYKVTVNGTEITDSYQGSLVGDGTSTGNKVNFQNNTVTFTNEYQLADLIINKNVTDTKELAMDPNQSFLFHVTGTPHSGSMNAVDMYVTILGDGELTIKNLPVGNYMVKEITDWSWRYDLTKLEADKANKTITNSDTISFVLAYGGETVTATNDRTKDKWLDGDCYAENAWNEAGTVSKIYPTS